MQTDLDTHITRETPHSASFLSSLCINPPIRFKNQNKDEIVLVLVRRHPATQIPWVVLAVFLTLFSLFTSVFIARFFTAQIAFFCVFFSLSVIFTYSYTNIVHWIYNVGIITEQRVVDIDFLLFTSTDLATTTIEDITEVNTKSSGFWAGIFRYGTVFVSTRGPLPNIEFGDCPDPQYVTMVITDLMKNYDFHKRRTDGHNH